MHALVRNMSVELVMLMRRFFQRCSLKEGQCVTQLWRPLPQVSPFCPTVCGYQACSCCSLATLHPCLWLKAEKWRGFFRYFLNKLHLKVHKQGSAANHQGRCGDLIPRLWYCDEILMYERIRWPIFYPQSLFKSSSKANLSKIMVSYILQNLSF